MRQFMNHGTARERIIDKQAVINVTPDNDEPVFRNGESRAFLEFAVLGNAIVVFRLRESPF